MLILTFTQLRLMALEEQIGKGFRPCLRGFDLARLVRSVRDDARQAVQRASGPVGATAVTACQVKPTFRMKCPSLSCSTPPPAQCTMNASKMMARMTTTNQKKNTMMPGMAYPATVLALATTASYPQARNSFEAETLRQSGDFPESLSLARRGR